jgi:hypothetical protein
VRQLSPSIPLADGNANFQVLWEDGERVFCRVGSHANADGSVLTVLPAAEHPTPATLDRLAHEYGLKEELDGAWALHPLEVVTLTRTEAANNGVSVRTQLAEGLPRLQEDRVQLQQVLLNLIINAIEAMRDVGKEERELRITDNCGPAQTYHVALSLASLCLLIRLPHRAQNRRAEDDYRR